SARSDDFIVKRTNRLFVKFNHVAGSEGSLPDRLPETAPSKEPGLGPPTAPAPGKTPEPAKERKPMVLEAGTLDVAIKVSHAKSDMENLHAVGAVQVQQEGETPKDKGIDIMGSRLYLTRELDGAMAYDTLKVWGDAKKTARLQLGELILAGPLVTL